MKRKIIWLIVSLLVFCILLISVNQISRFIGQTRTKNLSRVSKAEMAEVLEYLKENRNEEAIVMVDFILDKYKQKELRLWTYYTLRNIKANAYKNKAESEMRWLKELNLPISDDAIDLANKSIKEFEVMLDSGHDVSCSMALYQIGYIYSYVLDERRKAEEIWRRLINTYPESPLSSVAKFLLGEISTEELLKTPERYKIRKDFLFGAVAAKSLKDGDLEKAKEYYQKIIEYNETTKEIAGMDGEIRSVWAARELKRLEEGNK